MNLRRLMRPPPCLCGGNLAALNERLFYHPAIVRVCKTSHHRHHSGVTLNHARGRLPHGRIGSWEEAVVLGAKGSSHFDPNRQPIRRKGSMSMTEWRKATRAIASLLLLCL